MGFLALLIIILVGAGILFFNIKMSNLKHRATQHILKDTGISSSDITAGFIGNIEKKHLQKFLEEHPSFTEESIKELLKQYTVQLLNKNSTNEFSQEVYEKMQKDSKLDKMQGMEFKRVNISYYGNSKLNATVFYTDNKDEYNIYLNCNILGDKIQLDKYQIAKGAVVGF
jgi:uncharacterized protein YneF (UPF0154 family)